MPVASFEAERLEAARKPAIVNALSRWQARDPAIDVIRGICLISMILGHLNAATSGSSVGDQLVHLPLFVDGAAGFVFLSGVSVALADSSRYRRGVPRRARVGWILQRSGFIFAVHVAMTIGVLMFLTLTRWPVWAGQEHLDGSSFVDVLKLDRLVVYLDVLPMYAIFLAFAALALWSRAPKWLAAVAIVSSVVYIASQFWPEWTTLQSGQSHRPEWVLGAWQALFFGGLLAGTQWSTLRSRLANEWRVPALVVGGLMTGLLLAIRSIYALHDVFGHPATLAWRRTLEDDVFAKQLLTPPSLCLYVGFGTAFYVVVSGILERHREVFSPIEAMGMRSLRLYVGSCLAVVVYWAAVGPSPSAFTSELAGILAVLALCLLGQFRTIGRGRPWSF
jgi:hypothetical protein